VVFRFIAVHYIERIKRLELEHQFFLISSVLGITLSLLLFIFDFFYLLDVPSLILESLALVLFIFFFIKGQDPIKYQKLTIPFAVTILIILNMAIPFAGGFHIVNSFLFLIYILLLSILLDGKKLYTFYGILFIDLLVLISIDYYNYEQIRRYEIPQALILEHDVLLFFILSTSVIIFRGLKSRYDIERKRVIDQSNRIEESQKQIAYSEKMASLGRLLSGISHEMNSPLGIVKSNIDYVNKTKLDTLKRLFDIAQRITPQEFLSIQDLIINMHNKPQEIKSSREERITKDRIGSLLASFDIDDKSRVVDLIADIDEEDISTPLLKIIHSKHCIAMLEAARQLKYTFSNLNNTSIAVNRADNLMKALKLYTHNDERKEKELIDLNYSLDVALSLYEHEIKKGVAIEKHYEKELFINAYPEELSQIWSNLISNAIHAMNYKGKLSIYSKKNNLAVEVSIIDNGSGIPDDQKSKIFEPFYTTKPIGVGSGLGLDIVKKAVEKHNGEIMFDSKPGKTIFKVNLKN